LCLIFIINDIYDFIIRNRGALKPLSCGQSTGLRMSFTYLITGGAGFIGRHLCAELLAAGAQVRVLDSLVPQVHADNEPSLPQGIEFVEGDVRDTDLLDRALTGVDAVFHLAAEVGVGQSMYEIVRYVGGNDLATATLLERLANHPVQRLVVASSMSVYGEGMYRSPDGERHGAVRRIARAADGFWDPVAPDGRSLGPIPTDETKQVDLASIYALTKYMQERSCQIFGGAYGVEVVALRLFNVFGAGQALSNPYTGVLANFGARLLNGQPPLVFEDGQQRRDFVHVRDVACAFRLAMESPRAVGHTINIGSGHSYTIRGVAELLAEAMGVPEIAPMMLDKARAGDIRHCFADIGKARELIGYRPRYLLEDSLDELAQWIRASRAMDRGEDARQQLEARGLVT
jgi:dTDP-L-rhamnose 4-epimerase